MFCYNDLHIGHFVNKTLKDIANRYKLLLGHQIDFKLGFNCYGILVENEALR